MEQNFVDSGFSFVAFYGVALVNDHAGNAAKTSSRSAGTGSGQVRSPESARRAATRKPPVEIGRPLLGRNAASRRGRHEILAPLATQEGTAPGLFRNR
jgi:hypothetical protein